jgi:hypothetical protein
MRIDKKPGKQISVVFQYDKDGKNQPRTTNCRLFDIDPDGAIGKELGAGISTASRGDQVKKATGRKIALQKAMQNAAIGRIDRTTVWKQYFQKVAE